MDQAPVISQNAMYYHENNLKLNLANNIVQRIWDQTNDNLKDTLIYSAARYTKLRRIHPTNDDLWVKNHPKRVEVQFRNKNGEYETLYFQ